MRLWRILAIGAAVELSVLAALAAVLGLFGRWSAWLDALNVPAPAWLVLGLLAGLTGAAVIPPGRTRRAVLALSGVAVLVSGGRLVPDLAGALAPRSPPPPGLGVRVLSLNVWKNNLDPALALRRILEADADIVTLQERRGRFEAVAAGLSARYPGQTRCTGQAGELVVLSRRPVLAGGCRGQRTGEGPTRIAWLTSVDARGRPFTVMTTHFGWPVPLGRQDRQRDGLGAFLKAFDPDGLIVTGDFNTPSWTAAMAVQDGLFEPLTRRTAALATWPAVLPIGSWAAPFPVLPIDHVYAGPAWRTARVRRGPFSGSDHYPVVADLWRP